MGVAESLRVRVTQVLVVGSIYQGAILVHSEPQSYPVCFKRDTNRNTDRRGLAQTCLRLCAKLERDRDVMKRQAGVGHGTTAGLYPA